MNRSLSWTVLILAAFNLLFALAEHAVNAEYAAPAGAALAMFPKSTGHKAASLVLSAEVGGGEITSGAAELTTLEGSRSNPSAAAGSVEQSPTSVFQAFGVNGSRIDADPGENVLSVDSRSRSPLEAIDAVALSRGSSSDQSTYGASAVSESTGNARCVKIDGIPENGSAERVQKELAEIVLEGYIAAVNVPNGLLYWVHVPPARSHREADEILRHLGDKSVDAFKITTEGELYGAVSLGVFQDSAGAERLVHSLGDIGYPVKVTSLPRSRTMYSVSGVIDAATTRENVESKLASLIPGLKVEIAACESKSIAY